MNRSRNRKEINLNRNFTVLYPVFEMNATSIDQQINKERNTRKQKKELGLPKVRQPQKNYGTLKYIKKQKTVTISALVF